MLDSSQKSIVQRLTAPQFANLVGMLGIDIHQFAQGTSPAQRLLEFENQLAIFAGLAGWDQSNARIKVTDALRSCMGLDADSRMVEYAAPQVMQGLVELIGLLGDPARHAAIANTLRPVRTALETLTERVVAMSRGKQAHEALHNLTLMLPELRNHARAWIAAPPANRGQRRIDIVRASAGPNHNIMVFAQAVAQLPHPANDTFGNTAALLRNAMEEIRVALDPSTPDGDPTVAIEGVLQPNVRQQPSEIQKLLATYAAELRFDLVSTALASCNFVNRDSTLDAMGNLHRSIQAMEKQHHDWQFLDNQIRGMESPIDALEEAPTYRKQAAMILRLSLDKLTRACNQPAPDGLSDSILALANKVATKLAATDSNLVDLRVDFLDLHTQVSNRFYSTDRSLIEACRDMETLCDPLHRLALALSP